jgi:acyl carrier protein
MTSLQKVLHALMDQAAERFEIDRDSLSADDDLFSALGIDSMQALELITVLENRFGIELPDYELQDVRDFRGLALVIHQRLT